MLTKRRDNVDFPSIHSLNLHLISNSNNPVICLIYAPELAVLNYHDGLAILNVFTKELHQCLTSIINEGEVIYNHSGYGLLVKLNDFDINRLYTLHQTVNSYRYSWAGYHIGFHCGVSYTTEKVSTENIDTIIGLLTDKIGISLITGRPEKVCIDENDSAFEIIDGTTYYVKIRSLVQKTIDDRAFILFAQPIVSTKDNSKYYEILIRLSNGDGGMIYPDQFISVCNNAGVSSCLDLCVIEQVFQYINNKGLVGVRFSINLMPSTICKEFFFSRTASLFHLYKINPHDIIFEVTESDLFDSDMATESISKLKELGCKIAIDDFGKEYSGFCRLKKINADIIKIDGSFIKNIMTDKIDRQVVKSFHQVAKMKNIQTVAEFVENEDIKQELCSIGVDWLQGYHTGKPAPIDYFF